MNLCSDGHEEVVYEGQKCPVCEIVKEKDSMIGDLQNDIEALKMEINELNSQIASQ